MRDVSQETISDTMPWYKILLLTDSTKQRLEKRKKSLSKCLEPSHKPKVFCTHNSMDFGRDHRTSTPHRSETSAIAERAVRGVTSNTSAVLLQSRLDEKWRSASVDCYCHRRHVQDLLTDGKTPCDTQFGEKFIKPTCPSRAMVEYHPSSAEFINLARKCHLGSFLGYELIVE